MFHSEERSRALRNFLFRQRHDYAILTKYEVWRALRVSPGAPERSWQGHVSPWVSGRCQGPQRPLTTASHPANGFNPGLALVRL